MTLSLDRLRTITTIVAHDSCADGTGSALLLKDALPDAEVVFVQHGTDAYKLLPATPGMLFCDITPPLDRVDEFLTAKALVLDHHRTARAVVDRFGADGVFADEAREPGVSGTVLAYRHVWKPLREEQSSPEVRAWVERFAALTGIRDTWQTSDPRWRDACQQAYVMFFQSNVEWLNHSVSTLAACWAGTYEWIGRVLVERQAKGVLRSIASGVRLTSKRGTKVLAFNSKSNTSDAAEVLGAEVDLIVGFGYEADEGTAKLIFSTRSHADFDCSALARRFGGGGHTKAAGFSILTPADEGPYRTIVRLLDEHEGG
jgi:oligoribonuclease NrnB/cAMP/cGMP phosphodiesterase (DHH superfamily)